MAMSVGDAERATSELDVGLRLAGVGRLFDYLAADDTDIRPSVWCPGRCDGQGVVVTADARMVAILRVRPMGIEPDVAIVDPGGLDRLSIDSSMRAFTLHLAERDVVITEAPRTRLAGFVSYLITRSPTTRQRPDLTRPGGPT
ncbi:MAG TPA: hypothetical protein VLN74_17425 [Ilumatobacteraceae bacterium]|nr:hypothetical protein [Ilumatobacteraceae bacterium]